MSIVLLLGFVIIITPLQYLPALAVGPWVEFLFMVWGKRSKGAVVSHVWMAPGLQGFFACSLVACGHVSGLSLWSHIDHWP
jgi:hypothetical protein